MRENKWKRFFTSQGWKEICSNGERLTLQYHFEREDIEFQIILFAGGDSFDASVAPRTNPWDKEHAEFRAADFEDLVAGLMELRAKFESRFMFGYGWKLKPEITDFHSQNVPAPGKVVQFKKPDADR